MDAAAKQQIADRLKQASNILVTVSNDPSVDQLAACIGLTLLLNKMDKHATAVFSGQVPSTIEFLQPEKTIESNTDSLRDFIISLDKNKADKLRYKVEDQVVRIFITPYRTSLSEKDLVFSQGDFNVEVVMALGVADRAQLDAAITSHGRILHDATVISLAAGKGKAPSLGQINWQDPAASSLCEMLVSISEAFGTGLIDNQMATAFLTGIVAETHRFSNDRTSPKVMTMAAQLMAAGANQQLIVSKLEPPPPPGSEKPYTSPPKPPPSKGPTTGVLNVPHEPQKAGSSEVEVNSGEIHIDEQGNIVSNNPPGPQIQKAFPAALPEPAARPAAPTPVDQSDIPGPHTLLNPAQHQPSMEPPFTANTQPGWYDPYNTVPQDPLSSSPRPDDKLLGRERAVPPPPPVMPATPAPVSTPTPVPAIHTPTVDSARGAVKTAIAGAPFDPGGHPLTSFGAQPLSSELHTQPPANNMPPNLSTLPPPPPLPPPLTTAPGVVIPTPPPASQPSSQPPNAQAPLA